jgi:protein-arginine kinase activator protein McsA
MRCQCCRKERHTIQLRDVTTWKATDMVALCDSCAATLPSILLNASIPLAGAKTVLSALKEIVQAEKEDEPNELASDSNSPAAKDGAAAATCKACGMTLDNFRKEGRLGCPECYQSFGDPLMEAIGRMHGSPEAKHTGVRPGEPAPDSRVVRRRRVQTLTKQMLAAVESEHFERAAQLRDEITGLEKELKT